MSRDVLGCGWRFPVALDAAGQISTSAREDKVRESISLILSTAPGERVMRPEFGCRIHDYVFEVIDSSTMTQIKSAVREALTVWEPRIEVLEVRTLARSIAEVRNPIEQQRLDANVLEISVRDRIRATNAEGNLVYPFFLDGSAGA